MAGTGSCLAPAQRTDRPAVPARHRSSAARRRDRHRQPGRTGQICCRAQSGRAPPDRLGRRQRVIPELRSGRLGRVPRTLQIGKVRNKCKARLFSLGFISSPTEMAPWNDRAKGLEPRKAPHDLAGRRERGRQTVSPASYPSSGARSASGPVAPTRASSAQRAWYTPTPIRAHLRGRRSRGLSRPDRECEP